MYLNRCILRLLENRTSWTDWTIGIHHIHVDDEFWKRCAATIRNNFNSLTCKLGVIPLTIDTANQYCQLFIQDTEIFHNEGIDISWLSYPSDPLPKQLMRAFIGKVHAEDVYLKLLESAKKRPRIFPPQQAAQAAAQQTVLSDEEEED